MTLRDITKWGLLGIIGYFTITVILPPYKSAFAAQKAFTKIASTATYSTSKADLVKTALAEVEKVGLKDIVGLADIAVHRDGEQWVISADYLVTRQVYGVVSLLLEFSVASDRKSITPQPDAQVVG